jgi:hypothetical protein
VCPGLVQRLVTIFFYFSLALTHVSGHGSGLRAGQNPHLTRRVVPRFVGAYRHRHTPCILCVSGCEGPIGIAALRTGSIRVV